MYKPVPGAQILEVPEAVQEMFDWANSQGVRWPKIVYPVRFPPGYIGSMATAEILPGERIITAPNKTLFTTKSAHDSELKQVFEQCPETFSRSMLVLVTYLIWEKFKGAESTWAAFIKYQPKNPSNLQDWTPEELEELQDADLVADASQRIKYHSYGWNHWKTTLEKFPQFTAEMLTLEEYTWAFRVIGTRSFGKFMPYITLFPVGELLNHDNVQTYYIYQYPHDKPDATNRYSGIVDQKDHDDDLIISDSVINLNCEVILTVNEEINKNSKDLEKMLLIKQRCKEIDTKEDAEMKEHKKYRPPDMDLTEKEEKEASICAGPDEHYLPGSEVYMSYGRYSNRQLLSTYGFTLKENYYNYARIRLMFKNLASSPEQEAVFTEIDAYCVFKFKADSIGNEFLRVLRGLNWKHEYRTEAFLNPIMAELEIQALSVAIRILNTELAKFKTTYEEDLELLTNELPLRTYFAILYRSQIKEILIKQLKFMQIAKCIMERLHSGVSFSESISLVNSYETADGIHYLDLETNRKALQSYLEAYKTLN